MMRFGGVVRVGLVIGMVGYVGSKFIQRVPPDHVGILRSRQEGKESIQLKPGWHKRNPLEPNILILKVNDELNVPFIGEWANFTDFDGVLNIKYHLDVDVAEKVVPPMDELYFETHFVPTSIMLAKNVLAHFKPDNFNDFEKMAAIVIADDIRQYFRRDGLQVESVKINIHRQRDNEESE